MSQHSVTKAVSIFILIQIPKVAFTFELIRHGLSVENTEGGQEVALFMSA